MRIAVDAMTLCDARGMRGAGVSHYTFEVLRRLPKQLPRAAQVIAYVPSALSERDERELRAVGVRVVRPLLPRIPFLSRHVFFPLRLWLARSDVLFAPSGETPWLWGGKSVLTIHDVFVFEHPEWFPDGDIRNLSRTVLMPRSVKRANAILAVSEATRQATSRVFPSTEEKTQVVYEGVDVPVPSAVREQPMDTVLFVGTIEPRKNLVMAVRAFDLYLRAHPDRVPSTRFVIAGRIGWKADGVLAAIQDVNQTWRDVVPEGVVAQIGAINDGEKAALYARAQVFLFPSLDEGFGLPVLEAMANGLPVITTPVGAIPEIAGDTVLYVTPDDVESMSLAIAQCLLLPEAVVALRQESYERASRFTWEATVDAVAAILDHVARKQ